MNRNKIETVVRDLVQPLSDSFSITVSETHDRLTFNIQTESPAPLIGKHGEHLRALNYLALRLAEARELVDKGEKFAVDVNNYNTKKIHELEKQAHALARRVQMFKHEIEMSPMNPYERMVVHEALRDHENVGTESRGEGTLRHVVIVYRDKD